MGYLTLIELFLQVITTAVGISCVIYEYQQLYELSKGYTDSLNVITLLKNAQKLERFCVVLGSVLSVLSFNLWDILLYAILVAVHVYLYLGKKDIYDSATICKPKVIDEKQKLCYLSVGLFIGVCLVDSIRFFYMLGSIVIGSFKSLMMALFTRGIPQVKY
ncbi:hypothetical protein WA158_001735 [Blastocystis sp. Blastoise]